MISVVRPDSARCYAVALSMLIYVFFAMAVLKSSSVLYVGSMQLLDLNREEASWPATLTVMMSELGGPAFSMLVVRTSERFCLILGALLCSLPVMVASIWATELVSLCALVGVLHGTGAACSEVIPYVILVRHFRKLRGTVISSVYIITAVSGFIMPILFEYIRLNWGFRVCLFVMGFLNLTMLLGCIVINRVNAGPAAEIHEFEAGQECAEEVKNSTLTADDYLTNSILVKSQASSSGSRNGYESLEKTIPSESDGVKPTKKGLLTPSFIHIVCSRAATIFSLAGFVMVVLDYAGDRHLDSVQGVVILTVFTVGDLLSRVVSGSLIDLKLIPHPRLMCATFLIQGASFLLLIYVDLYATMLTASFLIGLTGGCRNILATVMVADECEESQLANMLATMNFVTGVTLIAQPPLIGFIRDTLGNYEPLMFGFAFLNLMLFATWFIQVLWERRRRC